MAGGILNQSTGLCCKTFLSREFERSDPTLYRASGKVRKQHTSRPSVGFTLGELIVIVIMIIIIANVTTTDIH